MRILSFRIENFRNLRLAECTNVPNFMVICGGNGCGKSALLEALMTAKEHAGRYGNFYFDPRAVSVNAPNARISMDLSVSNEEIAFVKNKFNQECQPIEKIIIEINKDGSARTTQRSTAVHNLLSYYGRSLGAPGFFDYIVAHRQIKRNNLETWQPKFISDDQAKQTLASGEMKFQFTKEYLASLKMKDLQDLEKTFQSGNPEFKDSLEEIKIFFNDFFTPMKFKDVLIHKSPFEFIISTPMGDIDIDDLSSGEKEILNTYIRFHQLNPKGAVILFDEADAHLHPDLERRYLEVLKNISSECQLILTTHSPEMMISAGTDALYTILKHPPEDGSNQFVRVSDNDQKHTVLSDLMGSRGIISFNQRIIFIEGENSSVDREIYESFYSPGRYNVSFVPAGNSSTVRQISEKVNKLLTASTGFQQYFSIIDGDIDRFEPDPTEGKRFFRLPVYHVENLLINENEIYEATKSMLGSGCKYNSPEEVKEELIKQLTSGSHLKSFTKALIDAKIAKTAKEAYDATFKNQDGRTITFEHYTFLEIEEKAQNILQSAINDDTWRAKCKGRELLKAFCGQNNIRYEHLRNILISRCSTPPKEISDIMNVILNS